jgi:secreted protein with Ig-like and vWFA domain/outer membrane protein assembly factor BamD (BamD/ComL family)
MEAAEKVPVLGDRLTSATDKTVSEGIPVIDTRSAGIKPPGQPKPAAAVTAGTMMLSGGIAMQQSESQLGVKTDVATPKDSKPAGEEQSKSNLAKGDLSSFAQREMTRRQETLAEGEQLLKEGRDSYAKGDYQQAVEKYTKILEKVPDSPMFADRRENYISHLSDASVALAMQNRKVGKYDEARKLLDNVIAADPNNDVAKRELNFLDDPLRTNPALTNEHTANVDKVRRSLYTAEGNYNLGKYDDAKREYEEALRTDPYNAAARRGLERIASAKTDYYRAAYDHTRAELLSQVDNAWELSIPADGEKGAKESPKDLDGLANNGVTIESKPAEGTKTDELATSDKELSDLESDARQRVAKLPAIRGMIVDRREQNAAAPKPDLTKLMEEIAATEDPYSTFSLNISDASFQVAQAALAKGERPDPAGIKVEQFYNAVDYGDPAPSAGEPVAVNIEQSAHPVVPGRNLVRVALKTAAAGRSAAQPLRLTLLVDQSGSMVREDRRAAMDKALAGLAGLLTDKDLVTVVGFSRTPRLLADGLAGDKAGKLADLVNQSANEGGTNLEEAIKLGEQLADRSKLAGAQNRIVLFTDGAANLGNADPVRLAEKVKQLRQKGIAFDIAGIAADGLNDELLGELARNGNGRYYVVGKGADESLAKQLAGAFRPAAENVKVQVHFNPERVGRYKLIGFEKDRLKTEDFRNDAVDAAELAAEEAGVAVYQVEPLPGGNGELGEVSVRFRDAASSQMVERTWTIPHDDKAPAFDRAAPSMQLAVLSMLAAEKLKGGPLGDAIDFKQLAEPRANVKRFYGTAGRVGEVLNMVDALK